MKILAAILIGLALAVTASAPAATTHRSGISQQTFRQSMEKLWEDHVAWTRMAIVGFAGGLPDLKATETRLLRNQVEIGNAVKPFYGAAAGDELTRLLKTHILQAVTVLKAAKAGDAPQLNAALGAWHANARQIAAFLAHANPRNWPLAATTMMMNDHLKLTTQEAVDELHGRWSASVADYDRVEREILGMSDTLSRGIIAQFPGRFAAA